MVANFEPAYSLARKAARIRLGLASCDDRCSIPSAKKNDNKKIRKQRWEDRNSQKAGSPQQSSHHIMETSDTSEVNGTLALQHKVSIRHQRVSESSRVLGPLASVHEHQAGSMAWFQVHHNTHRGGSLYVCPVSKFRKHAASKLRRH